MWLNHGESIKNDIAQIFRIKITSFFSPVVNAYFFLGQYFFPFHFVAYHKLQVLLHAVNSVLIFLLARKLLKKDFIAYLSALFFAFNPFPYEAVIWISSIMHILVTTFVLMGLLLYTQFLDTQKARWLILSLMCGLLAFFTKESGIIFPLLICILAWYHEGFRTIEKKVWQPLLWYVGLFLSLGFYAFLQQHDSVWIANGVYQISYKALYPLVTSFIHTLGFHSFAQILLQSKIIFGITLVVLVLILIFYTWHAKNKKHIRLLWLGILWTVVAFSPVLFFYFGSWQTLVQNRYAYLPNIGIALLIGFFLSWVSRLRTDLRYFLFIIFFFVLGTFVLDIHKTYHKDYVIIDTQMRGLVISFQELTPILQNAHTIVLYGDFPFFGNDYYRFAYKHFTVLGKEKNIDDWRQMTSKTERTTNQDSTHENPTFLHWDNSKMRLVPDTSETIKKP